MVEEDARMKEAGATNYELLEGGQGSGGIVSRDEGGRERERELSSDLELGRDRERERV